MAFSFLNKKATDLTNMTVLLDILKRGKTPDQCKCIDYLYSPDEDETGKKGCLKKKSGIMTMDEYCAHVDRVVENLNLKQRALDKIGLDESQVSEIAPINLSYFLYKGDGIRAKYEEIKNNDRKHTSTGLWKSVTNKYCVVWIFFSATQLYTYSYEFDTISNNSVERTRDFFYSDITCIRTEREIEEFIYEKKEKGCGCLKKKEAKYAHRDKVFDSLQITVPNDVYSFYLRVEDDSVAESIQAAKAMIREKKQA